MTILMSIAPSHPAVVNADTTNPGDLLTTWSTLYHTEKTIGSENQLACYKWCGARCGWSISILRRTV